MTICSKTSFKKYGSSIITCLFLLIVSSSTVHASNLSVSYSQLEQYVVLQNENVLLKPAGGAVFLSTELAENWSANLNYQSWKDDDNYQNIADIDLDLLTWGGSISYYQDNWYVSTSLSASEDDLSITSMRSNAIFREENTQVISVGILAGYNGYINNWLYDLTLGAQYDDWDIDKKQQKVQPDREVNVQSNHISDSSTNINASLSLAYYLPFSNDTSLLFGSMVSWNYMLTDDDELRSNELDENSRNPLFKALLSQRITSRSTTRRTSNTQSRVTAGDDNYGQLTLYLSYELSESLSVDLDTSIELASDDRNQSYAIGLSYSF